MELGPDQQTMHDIYLKTISALGGSVSNILLDIREKSSRFCSKITISKGNGQIEIDCLSVGRGN